MENSVSQCCGCFEKGGDETTADDELQMLHLQYKLRCSRATAESVSPEMIGCIQEFYLRKDDHIVNNNIALPAKWNSEGLIHKSYTYIKVILCYMADGTKLPPALVVNNEMDYISLGEDIFIIGDPGGNDRSAWIVSRWLRCIWSAFNCTEFKDSLMIVAAKDFQIMDDMMDTVGITSLNINSRDSELFCPLRGILWKTLRENLARERRNWIENNELESIGKEDLETLYRFVNKAWETIEPTELVKGFQHLGITTFNTCGFLPVDSSLTEGYYLFREQEASKMDIELTRLADFVRNNPDADLDVEVSSVMSTFSKVELWELYNILLQDADSNSTIMIPNEISQVQENMDDCQIMEIQSLNDEDSERVSSNIVAKHTIFTDKFTCLKCHQKFRTKRALLHHQKVIKCRQVNGSPGGNDIDLLLQDADSNATIVIPDDTSQVQENMDDCEIMEIQSLSDEDSEHVSSNIVAKRTIFTDKFTCLKCHQKFHTTRALLHHQKVIKCHRFNGNPGGKDIDFVNYPSTSISLRDCKCDCEEARNCSHNTAQSIRGNDSSNENDKMGTKTNICSFCGAQFTDFRFLKDHQLYEHYVQIDRCNDNYCEQVDITEEAISKSETGEDLQVKEEMIDFVYNTPHVNPDVQTPNLPDLVQAAIN